jgi:hypothetical protein
LTKTLLEKKQLSNRQGLPVKKKRLLIAVFTSVFLSSALAGTLLVNLGKANPTVFTYAALPIISVHSPANNTYFNSNEVLVNFSVTRPREWEMTMSALDWKISQELQRVSIHVDSKLYQSITVNNDLSSAPFTYFSSLTNLTDGEHNITIRAYASAFEYAQWYYRPKSSTVSNSSTVHFMVDTSPPAVTVLELENKEYLESEVVPLTFTINEPVSNISYVLDGQENVTIVGNCTVSNLPYGEHNITVFATDIVGNVGISKTIHFDVARPPEPFPTTLVATASVGTIAVVGVGLLVHFRKRKR